MSDNGLEIRGDVYAEDFKNSLRDLAIATKKDVATLIKEQAPTMARYLAAWTMPIAGMGGEVDGLGMSAKKAGEGAVERDINRAYVDSRKVIRALREIHDGKSGDNIARMFTRAVKKNDAEEAQAVLRKDPKHAALDVIIFDGGKSHKTAQRNGRVPKNNRPKVVIDWQNLRDYKKRKRGNVGWTKAAWINAGKQIGGKTGRVPKWITRHGAAPASGVFQTNGVSAESRITSGVPWVFAKIDDRRAMESFDRSMKKAVETQLRKLAEKERNKK